MTTKIKIENDANSNGDVIIELVNPSGGERHVELFPGDAHEAWMTTSSAIFITERWPTQKPRPPAVDEAQNAG